MAGILHINIIVVVRARDLGLGFEQAAKPLKD